MLRGWKWAREFFCLFDSVKLNFIGMGWDLILPTGNGAAEFAVKGKIDCIWNKKQREKR